MIVDTQVGRGEVPKYDLFIKLFMTIGMLALVLYIYIIQNKDRTSILHRLKWCDSNIDHNSLYWNRVEFVLPHRRIVIY